MKLVCNTCSKEFDSKIADKDPKLANNLAFCSELCWLNNKQPKEIQ